MVQNFAPLRLIFHTPTKVDPTSLWIGFRVNPVETFQENRRKPIHWLILALLGPKMARKFCQLEPFFTHTRKCPQCTYKPILVVSYKKVLRKWPKTYKVPIFTYFFVIKDPLKKLEAKNQNSTSTTFCAILLCTFKPNIGTIGWKLGAPIQFEKRLTDGRTDRRMDGRRTARHRIYKPRWSIGIILFSSRKFQGSMMTSSNGNIFRVTGHLCGNSPHKSQWRGALMLSLICVWINDWVNNREAGDLRRYSAHYDVIVMHRKGQRPCVIFPYKLQLA